MNVYWSSAMYDLYPLQAKVRFKPNYREKSNGIVGQYKKTIIHAQVQTMLAKTRDTSKKFPKLKNS